MKLADLVKAFDEFASFSLQENYDNSGIQYGQPNRLVNKGLICVDVTEAIIEEAIEKGCDVVISHHPLIFCGIKKLTGKHYTERVLVKAIQKDIAIISVHTNLDTIFSGVNNILAQKLGLENLALLQERQGLMKKLVTYCPADKAEGVRAAIFEAGAGHIGEYDCCSFNMHGEGSFRAGDNADPYVGEKGELHFEKEVRIETILPAWKQNAVIDALIRAHPYEEVAYDMYAMDNSFNKAGTGMMGTFKDPLSEKEFLTRLKKVLGSGCIRHSELTGKQIRKVALCGGSGSFMREKAIAAAADAFVTADIKYHDFFDADGKILLADVGHYESEQFTKEILHDVVRKKFTNFALLISDRSTNPVRYF
jgi:dinuclear metal center YbgI/SA1388 family protein